MTYLGVRFVRIHTAICRTWTASPHKPSRANAQRTPDWTSRYHCSGKACASVTLLRRGHLGEVVSGARNGQAPTVGQARLHDGGAGAKNASCFFGRTLRNVHFGNARLTPPIRHIPTTRCPSPLAINQPANSSHRLTAKGPCARCTHATHFLTCPQPGRETDSRAMKLHDTT